MGKFFVSLANAFSSDHFAILCKIWVLFDRQCLVGTRNKPVCWALQLSNLFLASTLLQFAQNAPLKLKRYLCSINFLLQDVFYAYPIRFDFLLLLWDFYGQSLYLFIMLCATWWVDIHNRNLKQNCKIKKIKNQFCITAHSTPRSFIVIRLRKCSLLTVYCIRDDVKRKTDWS